MRWLLVCFIGCGGTTSGGDASVDGSVPVDGSSADSNVTDTGSDAMQPTDSGIGDASTCSMLAPMGCTTCCINAAGGTGGFELLYNNACLQCASCGPNVRPCGTNMSPPASGGCIQCLKFSLMQGQPWTMCQQNAQCKAFVECFAQCPTK